MDKEHSKMEAEEEEGGGGQRQERDGKQTEQMFKGGWGGRGGQRLFHGGGE